MEKINIVKLLKDCPEGTKLYSLVHGEVELTRVGVENIYCKLSYLNREISFYSDGRWVENKGECILFPSKENRDWSTFQRPFKDGDIVATSKGNQIFIFKENVVNIDNSFSGVCYCGYDIQENKLFKELRLLFSRLATEEEKEKFFKAIKDNGYKWNAETKTLEKVIVPKFKVGDRIKSKDICTKYLYDNHIFTITEISRGKYWSNRLAIAYIEEQDDWELVPNKFDITTLKPFDKVLVRDSKDDYWNIGFFSFKEDKHFCTEKGYYAQCIPYESNEHLLGTTNACDEYFKTWK